MEIHVRPLITQIKAGKEIIQELFAQEVGR